MIAHIWRQGSRGRRLFLWSPLQEAGRVHARLATTRLLTRPVPNGRDLTDVEIVRLHRADAAMFGVCPAGVLFLCSPFWQLVHSLAAEESENLASW